MKKIKVIEVKVCDYCGSEKISTFPCPICHKDMCFDHLKNIEGNYSECLFICKRHKLTIKEKQIVRDYMNIGLSKPMYDLIKREEEKEEKK